MADINIRDLYERIDRIYFGLVNETTHVYRETDGSVTIFASNTDSISVPKSDIQYLINSLEKHLELCKLGE